jgi:UDP-3-O-[3-hydroxymyristoyl] glucosamine N-acyltransferase
MANILDIHVLGSGGFAKEFVSDIRNNSQYRVAGVWSDVPFNNDHYSEFYRGTIADAASMLTQKDNVIMAIAHSQDKKTILEKMGGPDAVNWINYIASTAVVSPDVTLGKGNIISHFAVLGADAVLEDFVFISAGSMVGHDSRIGKFTTVFPQCLVAGFAHVGEACVIGAQCVIFPHTTVPANTEVRAKSRYRNIS